MNSVQSSLFSITETPSLLSQLAAQAKSGLQAAPRSFKHLEQLTQFFQLPVSEFGETHPLAIKLLNGQLFQDRQGALNRLTPLAQRCVEILDPIETALSDPSEEVLKPLMQGLSAAHTAFRNQYVTEYQQACPYEPFTILKNHPQTIRIYLHAFFNQLGEIPLEKYLAWKESATMSSEDLLPIFSRLAIHHLLENPQIPIPELFQENDIAALRASYEELESEERSALLQSLRGDAEVQNVPDLAQEVALIASSTQLGNKRQTFNGVIRFVYEEAGKSFALLDKMNSKKFPQSIELQFRTVFLALLKQDSLADENLPMVFASKQMKKEVLAAFQNYRALTEEQKLEFERLFLDEKDPSLFLDWKRIYFNWGSSISIPLHLLARLKYQREAIGM